MSQWKSQMLLAVLILVQWFPPAALPADRPDREAKVLDRFLAAVQQNDQIDAELRRRVRQTVQSLRRDPSRRSLAITEGLRQLYPEFRTALELLADADPAPAIEALGRLAASDDPFLAAEASFYVAQAFTFQERYEEAMPLLKTLLEEKPETTVQTGEATFLLGVCQARTLQRQEAIATLTRFLDRYPNAPERMRIGAWRQREQLKLLQEGTLADVYDRMDFARRHLHLQQSGKPTQQQQEKIVSLLAKLIKEAEQRECNCSGGGQGQPGQQAGANPGRAKGSRGGNSRNENGVVRRTYRRGPESPWSKLRDRQRDPAYSAIKEKFPARYQQLIEQYYKSFQNEGG